MKDDLVTTLTERGQTSIPSSLRREARLKAGLKLHWQKVSDYEFRVTVPLSEEAPGAFAMLGYARRFCPKDSRSSDEILRELREGEET